MGFTLGAGERSNWIEAKNKQNMELRVGTTRAARLNQRGHTVYLYKVK